MTSRGDEEKGKPELNAPEPSLETPTLLSKFVSHINSPLPTPLRREILLTLTTFQTGLLDASVYISLGHVFVANMTGNIVLLGLAIANLKTEADVLPICISLVAFFVGGLVTGVIERIALQENHTRLFFTAMTLVDCVLNFVAATLVVTVPIVAEVNGNMRLIIFALLAFGQGLQLVVTKRAGLPEFANAVVTNTYVDLSTDPKLFALWGPGVRERNRRAVSLLSLLAGALVGAEIYKYAGLDIALFVAGGVSFITAVGWSL